VEHAGAVDQVPLSRIEVPSPEKGGVIGGEGREAGHRVGELAPAVAQEHRVPHAVEEAGRGRLGGVQVAVGVEPEHAGSGRAESGRQAEADAAVAGEHHREAPPLQDLAHRLGGAPHEGDAGRDLGVEALRQEHLGYFDLVPRLGEALGEPVGDEVAGARAHADVQVAGVVRNDEERDAHCPILAARLPVGGGSGSPGLRWRSLC
jgi:hypothetical protein